MNPPVRSSAEPFTEISLMDFSSVSGSNLLSHAAGVPAHLSSPESGRAVVPAGQEVPVVAASGIPAP